MEKTSFSKIKYYRSNYGRIIENFFSLSVLNAVSFIFPLITVPYLARVLGAEKFGIVSFATVVIQYFMIFTSFGFGFSATQQISINQQNKKKVSDIFAAVIFVKLFISVLCAVVLLLLIVFFAKFHNNSMVLIYAFGMVIGDALVPVWLFQGMEKMKFITIVNLVSKLIFTLLIFVFIRSEADFLYVTLLNSFGYLVAGLLSFIIAYRLFKLEMVLPKITEIKKQLIESWPIFVSTFSINIYRNMNVLILGLFTNMTLVGYYSSAEKVIKGMQSFASPLSDALFPYISKRFAKNTEGSNIKVLFRLSSYYFVGLAALSVLFLIFAKPIATVFLGQKFIASIPDIQIMSFVIMFGGMNYLLGIVGLVNMGFKKKFMVFVAITGVISIINLFWLVYYFADKGASASMLISEFVLFVLLSAFILKLKKVNG